MNVSALFSGIDAGNDQQQSLTYEFETPSMTGVRALVGTTTSEGTTYAWETVNVTASGSTVTGTTATSSQTAFTVSVGADGTVKFDQVLALEHSGTGADVKTLGDLTLKATLTDMDGDEASTERSFSTPMISAV